jgi:hypothetical protein
VGEESGDRGWALEGFDDGIELGGCALIIGVWCCFSLELLTLRLQYGTGFAEFCWVVEYFLSLFVHHVGFCEHIALTFGLWYLPSFSSVVYRHSYCVVIAGAWPPLSIFFTLDLKTRSIHTTSAYRRRCLSECLYNLEFFPPNPGRYQSTH